MPLLKITPLGRSIAVAQLRPYDENTIVISNRASFRLSYEEAVERVRNRAVLCNWNDRELQRAIEECCECTRTLSGEMIEKYQLGIVVGECAEPRAPALQFGDIVMMHLKVMCNPLNSNFFKTLGVADGSGEMKLNLCDTTGRTVYRMNAQTDITFVDPLDVVFAIREEFACAGV